MKGINVIGNIFLGHWQDQWQRSMESASHLPVLSRLLEMDPDISFITDGLTLGAEPKLAVVENNQVHFCYSVAVSLQKLLEKLYHLLYFSDVMPVRELLHISRGQFYYDIIVNKRL